MNSNIIFFAYKTYQEGKSTNMLAYVLDNFLFVSPKSYFSYTEGVMT